MRQNAILLHAGDFLSRRWSAERPGRVDDRGDDSLDGDAKAFDDRMFVTSAIMSSTFDCGNPILLSMRASRNRIHLARRHLDFPIAPA